MGDLAVGETVYAFECGRGLVKTLVMAKWASGRKRIFTLTTRSRKVRVSGEPRC
jgi:hypothetical protein